MGCAAFPRPSEYLRACHPARQEKQLWLWDLRRSAPEELCRGLSLTARPPAPRARRHGQRLSQAADRGIVPGRRHRLYRPRAADAESRVVGLPLCPPPRRRPPDAGGEKGTPGRHALGRDADRGEPQAGGGSGTRVQGRVIGRLRRRAPRRRPAAPRGPRQTRSRLDRKSPRSSWRRPCCSPPPARPSGNTSADSLFSSAWTWPTAIIAGSDPMTTIALNNKAAAPVRRRCADDGLPLARPHRHAGGNLAEHRRQERPRRRLLARIAWPPTPFERGLVAARRSRHAIPGASSANDPGFTCG